MKVIKIYIEKLTFLNYSTRTIETYSCYLEKFLVTLNKNPYHITTKDIEGFLLDQTYSSISQQNQYIGSLKLFAKYILGKSYVHLNKIKRPRKEKKLPKVIDAELLAQKIKSIANLKHRAILTLGLSCGLRVSEVINLKWDHLDRKRNVLYVINGKGKKDRPCPLNKDLIKLLEDYYREFRPKEYVFNGQFSNQYSASSIQKIVKRYLHPKMSYHWLRHSFATYALDNNTELAALSRVMGHKKTSTTGIYYHTSNRSLRSIKQAL
jgi:site-specific recombinase XerD